MTLAIRCVSIAGSPRRARMAEQLDAAGLDWSFFDARTTAPEGLRYDPARAVRRHGRELTPGELGCFASHHALWREVADDDGPDMLLVLEDDLIVNPVFFQQMGTVAEAARPYGYLRLYAKVPAGARLEAPFLDRHVARFSGRAYGTQAYFLTREAARRLLRSVKEVVRPVDDEMDRYWVNGLPICAVFPFPVMEVAYGSTIEGQRRVLPPLPRGQRLRWQMSKTVEKVRRHMADLAARVRR